MTRYDIYHMLPKIPISHPKLDGLCELANAEEPDEHGYTKRNASRRSMDESGVKRRSYPPGVPQQRYGQYEEYEEEEEEEVTCDDVYYRSFDGSCNNLKYPLWGKAGTAYTRLLIPDYADGKTERHFHSTFQEQVAFFSLPF